MRLPVFYHLNYTFPLGEREERNIQILKKSSSCPLSTSLEDMENGRTMLCGSITIDSPDIWLGNFSLQFPIFDIYKNQEDLDGHTFVYTFPVKGSDKALTVKVWYRDDDCEEDVERPLDYPEAVYAVTTATHQNLHINRRVLPNYTDFSPTSLIKLLEEKQRVAFLRIGDGEQYTMLTSKYIHLSFPPGVKSTWGFWRNTNKNGCTFFPDLGEALVDILLDPETRQDVVDRRYLLAINNVSIYNNYMFYDLFAPIDFSDASFFQIHIMVVNLFLKQPDRFRALLSAVNSYDRVIHVGPERAQSPLNPIRYDHFVTIPEKNCWEHREDIQNTITSYLSSVDDKPTILVLQGGLGIKPIAHYFYKTYPSVSIIDIGSPIDFFLSFYKRGYLRGPGVIDGLKKTYSDLLVKPSSPTPSPSSPTSSPPPPHSP